MRQFLESPMTLLLANGRPVNKMKVVDDKPWGWP